MGFLTFQATSDQISDQIKTGASQLGVTTVPIACLLPSCYKLEVNTD